MVFESLEGRAEGVGCAGAYPDIRLLISNQVGSHGQAGQ